VPKHVVNPKVLDNPNFLKKLERRRVNATSQEAG